MAEHHFCAFAITWVGVGVVLYLRHLAKQRAYLRRFPPVEGVPLDTLRGGNPFGERARAIWRATLQQQSDPELERQRRDLWRRWRYVLLWVYGFPILVFGVAALLMATGVLVVLP